MRLYMGVDKFFHATEPHNILHRVEQYVVLILFALLFLSYVISKFTAVI